jgi:hypothetical protein
MCAIVFRISAQALIDPEHDKTFWHSYREFSFIIFPQKSLQIANDFFEDIYFLQRSIWVRDKGRPHNTQSAEDVWERTKQSNITSFSNTSSAFHSDIDESDVFQRVMPKSSQ